MNQILTPDETGARASRSKTSIGVAVAIAATILTWAAAFPVIRIALQEFDAVPLASVRFAIASIAVVGWLAWRRPALPSRRDLVRIFASGATGIALYNILLNTGQRTVSAGAASFIVNVLPIFTALLAILVLGERFRRWAWVGTAVSLCGIAVIASGQPGGLQFGAGASFILAAALSLAVYFIVQKPLVPRYGALSCTALAILAGAVCLLPWLPEGLVQFTRASAGGRSAVVFLAVFPALVGYATWSYALGRLGAAHAANFLYLVPPVATALAVPLTHEVPAWSTLVGGAMALSGVILVNTKGRV